MNVALLEQIITRMEAQPTKVDMSYWISDEPFPAERMLERLLTPECSTAGCIAGYACALASTIPVAVPGSVYAGFAVTAAELLQISADRAITLFHVNNWPSHFKEEYFCATTPDEITRAVTNYIRHFIAEG